MNNFLRLPGLLVSLGDRSKTSVYNRVRDGLLPPPAKDGAISIWPEGEIEEVKRAIVAGCSNDEIRELVASIVARRTQLAAA